MIVILNSTLSDNLTGGYILKLELIPAYLKLEEYIEQEEQNQDICKKIMVEPYWNIISQWAPFPEDYKMPLCYRSKEEAKAQLDELKKVDWKNMMEGFHAICKALPKEDDDVMYIAIYPSKTDIPEGIYGTGVWGNIILNINAVNREFHKWLPFVFAHEYHHNVWGNYWYCLRNGEGLCGRLIESLIIEGEADYFAESIFGNMHPSWHYGVKSEEEDRLWKKFKKALAIKLPTEEIGKYMFGCEEYGISQNAGYYFGIQLVREFMEKNQLYDIVTLLETPVDNIYKYYQDIGKL